MAKIPEHNSKEIARAIVDFMVENNRPPTLREVANALGYASYSHARTLVVRSARETHAFDYEVRRGITVKGRFIPEWEG